MVKRLLSLEWKKFTRSSYFQRSLAIKIFMIFGALYFMAIFLFTGAGAYFFIRHIFPEQDPLVVVNNYLIFWFLFDIVYRFFVQQLPVMNIKPLMAFPIKRKTVIHFLLGKTTVSFFNFLPLFFFAPFSVVLLMKGYPPIHVVLWFLTMVFFELCINYLNFLINKIAAVFYIIAAVLLGAAALQYFHIYDITQVAGIFFNGLYSSLYGVLVPFLLMILLYRRNFAFIRKDFYIDGSVSHKTREVETKELSWLNRFGKTATFLKNDLRMIWRNKRPKKVVTMSLLFLFYGLFFYTNSVYKDSAGFLVFASLFITGGFLFTFGGMVPSWDSEYYKLLMSQNISYRSYLESKWYLMLVGTVIAFILSTPYLYFGWKIYGMIAAGGLFNIGLNTFITLYAGALHRVPIELNVKAKAFSNTQGFNLTQLLFIIPKMILPVLLFYIPYKLVNFQTGLVVLGLSGVLGLVFKNFFFTLIENVYQKGKYKTIQAYQEKA